MLHNEQRVDRDSSNGIATGYRLDGPGIESRWGRYFMHLCRPALGPLQPPVHRGPGFSGGKERLGRDADASPTSSAVGHERVELLPLWAVRPVQSLSVCTRENFTFYLTGWTVRGSNPGGGEIFRTCPDGLWVPPSLLYNGYRVFPRGKGRPGRDADLSPLLVPGS
jgi:hypothetical protein